METIINELKNAQNVRSNLSKLRQLVRDSKEKELSLEELDHNNWMLPFLKSEDAKTRKKCSTSSWRTGVRKCQNSSLGSISERTDAFCEECVPECIIPSGCRGTGAGTERRTFRSYDRRGTSGESKARE